MVPASYSFRGQRCFPLEALIWSCVCSVLCSLLLPRLSAQLPPSLAVASVYSWSGFQAKPRHHLRSQHSSTRRRREAARRRELATCHARASASPSGPWRRPPPPSYPPSSSTPSTSPRYAGDPVVASISSREENLVGWVTNYSSLPTWFVTELSGLEPTTSRGEIFRLLLLFCL